MTASHPEAVIVSADLLAQKETMDQIGSQGYCWFV